MANDQINSVLLKITAEIQTKETSFTLLRKHTALFREVGQRENLEAALYTVAQN